ncbi:lecithin retinol acyltransferase family protein [Vibrio splendidus]|uniref:lecithin retinol acyltransferase family protein n=1 Tax=Vibrio cyclitrophicus TaxID=47951 RepID=UPI001F51EDF8|nr:lecithin retinol acyltransferase family protein [Vibrio cyclitrophicus]
MYCDLAFGYAEHSGVYVGNGRIIHRNGKGLIEAASIRQFLADTSAITIYISCDANGTSVGFDDIANDAEALLGTQQAYSVLSKNCHQFCSYCITGSIHTNTFTLAQLKRDAREYIKASQWRAWDLTKR